MKTTFSSGVIVTSQFLNGFQQIFFDGQDLDHHYNPLGLSSLVQTGSNGLDSAYVSLMSDQPTLDSTGLYSSGSPISGSKVVTGVWNFGYDSAVVGNPTNTIANAPKSYTTNDKYNYAGGFPTPTVAQKFNSLADADIITKEILEQWVDNSLVSVAVFASTVPTTQTSAGNSGEIAVDSTHFYWYDGTNWQRVAADTTPW
jgi:hypothetical protein